ncbi:MAG: NblA-related protein [Drouetiella hepatica Uher 2000/2452]|jgi:hypothetical protein|uniref:NblA-related protein n=1 Tax=Drouetiella hepatica Uher 2000/2452 TaxID=904376 RepID=A0A951QE89_9CYAN|nr:NblA-related protein [Drouetiella hepatica Uher 2000/2452]
MPELSLEQCFALAHLEKECEQMTLDQIRDRLIQTYERTLRMEAQYRAALKKQWGIGDA